jgi:hypothetical protein
MIDSGSVRRLSAATGLFICISDGFGWIYFGFKLEG